MLGQSRSNILCFLTGTLTLGMLGATFVASASMFLIGFLCLVDFNTPDSGLNSKSTLVFNKDFFVLFKRFWLQYSFSAFSLCIVLVFITWGYSENKAYLLERVRIKIPFLGTYLAFFILPKVSNITLKHLLIVFITIMGISEIVVLMNYIMDYKNINIDIGRGGYIPTPNNHIRYSILVAFSLFFGIEMLLNAKKFDLQKESLFIKISLIFGFVAIHIITVRSGLIVFYSVGLLRVAAYIWSQKKWKYLVYLSFATSTVVFVSYQFIPSLRHKIDYTLWDIQMYKSGTIAKYSDGERLTSIEVGIEIAKPHKIWGVGYGDMYDEIKYYYYSQHPNLLVNLPHNQFVTTYTGAGIVGVLLLIIGLFVPLYIQIKRGNWLFIMVQLSLLISFLFESTIENTLGVTIMTFWGALFLNYGKNEANDIAYQASK